MAVVLTGLLAAAVAAAPMVGDSPDACPTSPATVAAACAAPLPAPGAPFAGPVLQVIDGSTVCVAQGPDPSSWIRVTLADAPARDGRPALLAAVFARSVVCVTDYRERDGVVAHCALEGVAVGGLVKARASDAGAWR